MAIPQKVMITGANGFIGRAIAQRFLELGSTVVGVDLQANPAMNVHRANVAVAGEWQKLAKGCDLVIHTAAVVSNTASAELYRQVSVGSVRKVIEAAIYGDASRFMHFSSIAAYGLDFATQRTEKDDICLLSGHPYCDAKAASEHAALAAHASGDMACTIIRPGDVYGPGSRPWVLIPLSLIRKNQFLLPAKGQGVFSPVYIDNLLDGTVAAATQHQASGQIYNVTDGIAVSCMDFFSHHWRWADKSGKPLVLPTRLAQKLTRSSEWIFRKVLQQPTEISISSLAMLTRSSSYSIAKAQTQLHYKPKIDLLTGMQQTERWLHDHKMIG